MKKLCVILLASAFLAACASSAPREKSGEIYERHAGMAVHEVRYSSIRSWQTAGSDSILIDFGARGQYLFTLGPECHYELHVRPTLGLDTRMKNVVTRLDRVVVGSERCHIVSIRPVDMKAVNAEMAERTSANKKYDA
jgi:hypothetical protein